MNTIIIDLKKKKQSLFPRFVLGITIGTIIKLCCGGDKILYKFQSFAKYQLLLDVSPDWLNELLRSMFNPWGTFKDKLFT